MKHLSRVSVIHAETLRALVRDGNTVGPSPADAKTDFLNALARAWSDFVFEKKNSTTV